MDERECRVCGMMIIEYFIGTSDMWLIDYYVLTSQFSELAISCVSWGVKENQHHYSGIFDVVLVLDIY